MRGKRILLCLVLLFSFVAGISAQVKTAQNEVNIDRLLRKENFTTLQFLVSTKEDVKFSFGEQCASGGQCVYDEDWFIRFKYVGEVLSFSWAQPNQPQNRYFITYSKPEFRGKLLGIEFTPRKLNVLSGNYIFPSGFDCAENIGIEFNCISDVAFVKYFYKKSEDGTIHQKKISFILHRPTKQQYETITGETVVKDMKEKATQQDEPLF
jgi:hypothetical protein